MGSQNPVKTHFPSAIPELRATQDNACHRLVPMGIATARHQKEANNLAWFAMLRTLFGSVAHNRALKGNDSHRLEDLEKSHKMQRRRIIQI